MSHIRIFNTYCIFADDYQISSNRSLLDTELMFETRLLLEEIWCMFLLWNQAAFYCVQIPTKEDHCLCLTICYFRPISGKHQHWPLSKNILRHSYSANTMALSWNSNNSAMFFVVLLLFLILICFYYVYCTLLSLSIVLLHVCTWLVGPAVSSSV